MSTGGTTLHVGAQKGSNRALIGSALLAVLVVAAAGISGTTHFAGPRWLPHWLSVWRFARHTYTRHSRSSVAPARAHVSHSASSFTLGTVVLWIIVGIAAVAAARLLWRWWAGRRARAA